MKTNFFQAIAHLNGQGKWIVTAEFSADKSLCVSVLLSDSIAEKTNTALQPMVFRGTPQELDEGFFSAIAEPVKQTASLFANATEYQKSLDNAKAQLEQKAKAKTESPKPKADATVDSKKAYDEKMKKVAELDSACKYEFALSELPSVEDYPDKKADIEKVRAELERKNQQLSLL
ncbi:MAG: PRTRC system protein E [Pedobacter sp.]|nr:PRTRC system protein E [Pedobacter sp.]